MRFAIFNRENIRSFTLFILGGTLIVFPTILIAETASNGFAVGLMHAFLYTLMFIGFFAGIIIALAIIGAIVNYFAHTTYRVKKLNKIDFLGSKDLYRDILEKYSPTTLSYIDQMNYDPKIAVVATLLNLEKNKYIKCENGKIEFLKDEDENLGMSEKYVYRRMKTGEKNIEAETLWNDLVYDGCKNGLLEERYSGMGMGTFATSLVILFALVIFDEIVKMVLGSIGESVGAIIVIVVWLFYCLYEIYKGQHSAFRTEEAEDINSKLEGLKTFLREYSNLKDRESNEIVLWEDYLIYSVIFKQNKKIISEYKKYFRIV